MSIRINKVYNRFDSARDHVMTAEAFEKYKRLALQWKEVTTGLSAEEMVSFDCLHVFFNDFLNTCCKDHFTKGFELGVDATCNITDRYIEPLYQSIKEDEEEEMGIL